MRVLDLGARPGSWLQYAAAKVGDTGRLVGLDRAPLDRPIHGARFVVGDVFAITPADLIGDLEAFDVVLSDMAPDTTGIRSVDQARSEALFERALDLAIELVIPSGSFVGKLFQGPDMQRLVTKARSAFDAVRMEKPRASRKESIEVYVVAMGRGSY